MILRMRRVRILGPRDRLEDVLDVLQDLEVVHLGDAAEGRKEVRSPAGREEGERGRRLDQLRKAADAVARAREVLGRLEEPVVAAGEGPEREEVAEWLRLARSTRRRARDLRDRIGALEEERGQLERYRSVFAAFEPLIEEATGWPEASVFQVVLEDGGEERVEEIREGLDEILDGELEMWSRELGSGETAMLILVPSDASGRMDEALSESGVQEMKVPDSVRGRGATETSDVVARRLEEIAREVERLREELADLRRDRGGELARAEAEIRDRILELEAMGGAGFTDRAFVLEGWVPAEEGGRMEKAIRRAVGEEVVVEEVAEEDWSAEEAPVVLRNPRLFEPFEVIVELLPLPRYGTMDPTPFVAVFFPMFFGLILGDVAYGTLLGIGALVLYRRSKPDTFWRSASQIAGACAAFAVIFGFLFGELLGDLGRHQLGLEPVLFDREEALLPFLGLAVALGAVHLLLGLVLSVVSAFRREGARKAVGPGITTLMVVLVLLALLAAVEVLPRAFFTPAVVAALVAFPILVVVEGLVAPVELLSTLGRILSYARIMALGTASVMMAVAANRMIGALGSVAVGALFALLFHAVNFVLGVFSPTIHALRLHYVEFFGTFYSPGGTEYRPFGHWRPGPHEGREGSGEEADGPAGDALVPGSGSRSRPTTLERR